MKKPPLSMEEYRRKSTTLKKVWQMKNRDYTKVFREYYKAKQAGNKTEIIRLRRKVARMNKAVSAAHKAWMKSIEDY